MYARVAAFEQSNASKADDLINTVRERFESARAELPDAQALLMLIDRKNARSLGITLFESEEALRQAEPAFERMGDEIPEELRGRRISVHVYEVIRHEGGQGAKAARVSSFEGSTDRIDEIVHLAEERRSDFLLEVLPPAQQMPGWKGYYHLADRVSGRSKVITLFESAETLVASEQTADELRRQAAESAGETITGVERYEVALSEQLAVR